MEYERVHKKTKFPIEIITTMDMRERESKDKKEIIKFLDKKDLTYYYLAMVRIP